MISIASKDAFSGFTFTAYNPWNIPVAPMVMIKPFLRESSMFFFPIKTSHLLYKVFYHQIKKKKNYLSHAGKDINHTNDMDASNVSCCTNPTALRLKMWEQQYIFCCKTVRSADEGTSVFNECRDCHNKWRNGWYTLCDNESQGGAFHFNHIGHFRI